jgi:hypothetical protein
MSTLRTLQLLVVLRTGIALLWHFLPFIWWPTDPMLDKLLRYNAYDHHLGNTGALIQIFVLWGGVAAAVGLFFAQNWGRFLFLTVVALTCVGALLSGVLVFVPIYAFVFITLQMLNGGILVLVFCSSLRASYATANS